ncbi:MAG: hypothetical protein DRJ06_01865 [Candidatus Aminicenantes bacterium]|nr:MAG: hypothetical protein DRJ06_01865 [Candidatus Aminicenantes bacterium]
MAIEIKPISSRRDLKTFIYLPAKIHQGHRYWVPPIYQDEWKYFDPKKNKAFSYCATIRLLAFRQKEAVGRIMGIINHRYNEYRQEKAARFGYLEAGPDKEVIAALLKAVEDWARQKGMEKIVGPYGFTDQDPEGFMVKGFDNRATIATYYNFEWMPKMVEELGYTKDIDYYVYKVNVPDEIPDFYRKIYQRVLKKGDFRVLEFRKRKELKPWIKPVLSLMNECYSQSEIYGYTPLDEEEMEALAKRYLPILNPRFVKVVIQGEEVVAFIVGIPDMTEGIIKARGKLFPFGFIHILRAAKKTKQLDLLLGAVKEPFRGKGLDVLMGIKMLESAKELGFEVIDSHHEMETNVRVRAEMERMGGQVYKKFRVYKKQL